MFPENMPILEFLLFIENCCHRNQTLIEYTVVVMSQLRNLNLANRHKKQHFTQGFQGFIAKCCLVFSD